MHIRFHGLFLNRIEVLKIIIYKVFSIICSNNFNPFFKLPLNNLNKFFDLQGNF